jgi:hypothetical protein
MVKQEVHITVVQTSIISQEHRVIRAMVWW